MEIIKEINLSSIDGRPRSLIIGRKDGQDVLSVKGIERDLDKRVFHSTRELFKALASCRNGLEETSESQSVHKRCSGYRIIYKNPDDQLEVLGNGSDGLENISKAKRVALVLHLGRSPENISKQP